jgi:hypothetical protein
MRGVNMLQWREGYELVLPPDVLDMLIHPVRPDRGVQPGRGGLVTPGPPVHSAREDG